MCGKGAGHGTPKSEYGAGFVWHQHWKRHMTGQMAGVLCVQHVLLSMAFGSIYWLPTGAIRTPECQEIDADGAGGNFQTTIENPPMFCYIKFK